MISERPVTKENRIDIIMNKLKDFHKFKLVITDRLRRMIFCAILQISCIKLGNDNQKVRGIYDWIKDLDYIRYVENIEEVKRYIGELINLEMNKYNNSMLINYYNKIKGIINSI